jgi:hypothetical protein
LRSWWPRSHLQERAGALGFDDPRAFLQARCDAVFSIPGIATELGVRDWQVQAALTRLQVRLALLPERRAAQRRRHTEEPIAARVLELGFADVGAYRWIGSWSRGGCWRRWPRSWPRIA